MVSAVPPASIFQQHRRRQQRHRSWRHQQPHHSRSSGGCGEHAGWDAGASGGFDGAGPNARFNLPHGIAVDSTETVTWRTPTTTIRKITTAGVVSTLAGISGFAGNVDGAASLRGSHLLVVCRSTGPTCSRPATPPFASSLLTAVSAVGGGGRPDRRRNRWNRHQCSFQSTSRHRH